MAIMLEINSKKRTSVARVLGRSAVELVEVEDDDRREFYWKLHKRIQRSCDISKYDGNIDLYRDFHRALDEVQLIFQMYAKKQKFDLLAPDPCYKTWLEAANSRVEGLSLSDIVGRNEYDSSSRRVNAQSDPNSVTFESRQVAENGDNDRKAVTGILQQSDQYQSDTNDWRKGIVKSNSQSEVFGGSSMSKARMGNKRELSRAVAITSADSNLSDVLSVDNSASTAGGKESWPSMMKPTPSSRLKIGRARATKGNVNSPSRVSTAAVFE